MPPRARFLLALAAVIVVGLAFAAAGCGGDSDETAAPVETTSAATTDTETGAGTTTATTTSNDDDTTSGDDDNTGIEDDTDDDDDRTTSEDDRRARTSASGGRTTSSRSGSTKQTIAAPVEATLFRAGGNTIICGLRRSALLCWRPASGFTIRLPRAGRPTQDVIDANRGLPRRVRSIPRLRKGRAVRRRGFRCTLVAKSEVRCTNAARHGFQLGKLLSYRF
ncbi:MAG: hypothetical protein M3322_08200 [Actinomycetota bacterium]|nr:hypothetical protein [Actinomycetota bacterium]